MRKAKNLLCAVLSLCIAVSVLSGLSISAFATSEIKLTFVVNGGYIKLYSNKITVPIVAAGFVATVFEAKYAIISI